MNDRQRRAYFARMSKDKSFDRYGEYLKEARTRRRRSGYIGGAAGAGVGGAIAGFYANKKLPAFDRFLNPYNGSVTAKSNTPKKLAVTAAGAGIGALSGLGVGRSISTRKTLRDPEFQQKRMDVAKVMAKYLKKDKKSSGMFYRSKHFRQGNFGVVRRDRLQ